jgi:hypothetical protein
MNKYIIEGGIDFYEELYKSLDIEELIEKTEEDKNLCLITNCQLVENFVQLNCGHKFNYAPLFLDLKNHRQKFNGLEGSSSKLAIDEIRCPYCRTKQKGVLPYYEDLGFPKINGVNDIIFSIGSKNSYSCYKPCEYLKTNPEFDPSGNEPVETNKLNKGNCKFHICFSSGTQLGYGYENYGDEKYYCWSHKKEMIKKYKQDIKIKAKEEANKQKLKLKEEAKKAKEEAKLKEKEEKQKAKEESKKSKQNTSQENVVLGQIDLSGNSVIAGCIEILKSGQNKGKPCGCKIILDDLCNRHFKIKNGIVINNI